MKYVIYMCGLFLLSGVIVLSQESVCPAVVQDALMMTSAACDGIERNQICYGNVQVEAELQDSATTAQFENTGDIINLEDITSLSLSGDAPVDRWGMALLSLQADLPDTLPGQNVTVLLFGNVDLENAGEQAAAPRQILTRQIAKMYTSPDTESATVGRLRDGATADVLGRDETGEWFLARSAEEPITGWIEDSTIRNVDALMTIAVIDPAAIDENGYEMPSLQAFYLRGNSLNPDCAEAPEEGMLIQTPAGVGELSLMLNDVQITLGSTALVQAVPGEHMTFTLQEGTARLTTQGAMVEVPEGATATIPLDENGAASGMPVVDDINTIWGGVETSRQLTCTGDNFYGPSRGTRTIIWDIVDNAIHGDPAKALIPGNSWVDSFEADVMGDGNFIDVGESVATVISPAQVVIDATITRTASDGNICELLDTWVYTYIGQAEPEE